MSHYVRATSLKEALEVLLGGGARVLAGGTDLMIHFRESRMKGSSLPEVLLDPTHVPELQRLELDSDRPYIGAAWTFRRLALDTAVIGRYGLLVEAALSVGSAQIRQAATIGGNVANASPAADGVSALVALGAVAEIASPEHRRRSPVTELISGPNRTTLTAEELIVGFELDCLPKGTGQAFLKVGRRQAVSVARLNLAVSLDPGLRDPRVVLGACFPTPRRLKEVESCLQSGKAGEKLWNEAGRLAAANFVEVCGWRSSAPYKVPTIQAMTARALARAWSRMEANHDHRS